MRLTVIACDLELNEGSCSPATHYGCLAAVQSLVLRLSDDVQSNGASRVCALALHSWKDDFRRGGHPRCCTEPTHVAQRGQRANSAERTKSIQCRQEGEHTAQRGGRAYSAERTESKQRREEGKHTVQAGGRAKAADLSLAYCSCSGSL